MILRNVLNTCAVAVVTAAISGPAHAVGPAHKPSAAFERAFLGEMDGPTRARVAKRATGGNSISGVIAVTLLNDNQISKHAKPGRPVSVVAVDFVRGVVVVKNGPGEYEPVRFDPRTLKILK